MKTIYFIRHAKSSWEDSSLKDFDRPLGKRGLRDAPFMAKMLKGKGAKIDAIISSPANRALSTAKYFATEFEINEGDIKQEESIYEAYVDDVMSIVNGLDDHLKTVLIFGHNPTFTSIANRFSDDYIANVPTCGIVKIEAGTSKWSHFERSDASVTAFHYPKEYF